MFDWSLGSLFALLASLAAVAGVIRYLVLTQVRLHGAFAKYAATAVRKSELSTKVLFTLNDDFGDSDDDLVDRSLLLWIPKSGPVFFHCSERILQAGVRPKDTVCTATYIRLFGRGMRSFLARLQRERQQGERTPVELVNTFELEPLGYLNKVDEPYLPKDAYADIDRACAEAAKGIGRVGILLYGPPGCGKTSLVKWLAVRHKLPIRLFVLSTEMSNLSVTRMFAKLPPRSIVLFEDFDNYFHGRESVFGNPSQKSRAVPEFDSDLSLLLGGGGGGPLTFDAILNGLDGVYNSYEGVVFAITVNDLNKVDDALKRRPSRIRHVLEVAPPGEAVLRRIFGGDIPEEVRGQSLDVALDVKTRQDLERQRAAETKALVELNGKAG